MTLRLSLSAIERALDVPSAACDLRGDDAEAVGVSIDTRTLEPGNLYVAVRGERFDGHDFALEAAAAGASALMVQRAVRSDLPQLIVDDTVGALGRLARHWLGRHPVPVVAITGSNGKTTTKEIVRAILERLGPVLATTGNLNNDFGVPLTLLRLGPEHRYAVIEMGASRAGDIARLVAIAPPDVAMVTGTGAAHLEGFGSLEGVAHAKSEIFDGLGPHGHAVYGIDDARAAILADRASVHRTRTFGVSAAADVRGVAGSGLRFETLGRRHEARFGLLGDHNGMNALAAIAAVQCLDVQMDAILEGLAAVVAAPGRLQERAAPGGVTVIDDSYNANPVSLQAAIELLARRGGRRHLVLGDMLELGEEADALHAQAGRLAKRLGIDRLWTCGPLAAAAAAAFGSTSSAFDDIVALGDALQPSLAPGDVVLVKGSRGSRMERVIDRLFEKVGRGDGKGAPRAGEPGARASVSRLHERRNTASGTGA